MEKIITGNWDGQPIWRYKTAAEVLADELEKGSQDRKWEGTCGAPIYENGKMVAACAVFNCQNHNK